MSIPGTEILRGAQVDLTELEPTYFEHIIIWRNQASNRVCFFSKNVFTMESQRRWYERYLNDPTDVTFIIVLKSGLPVGMLSLYSIDREARYAEFGRLLIGDESRRRRGIASEAVSLCLDYAVETLGLEKIFLEVFDWNKGAIRLYERFGFETTGYRTLDRGSDSIQPIRKMVLNLSRRRLS
jgi:RimJ/RimL family protein N-acetyltransferase